MCKRNQHARACLLFKLQSCVALADYLWLYTGFLCTRWYIFNYLSQCTRDSVSIGFIRCVQLPISLTAQLTALSIVNCLHSRPRHPAQPCSWSKSPTPSHCRLRRAQKCSWRAKGTPRTRSRWSMKALTALMLCGGHRAHQWRDAVRTATKPRLLWAHNRARNTDAGRAALRGVARGFDEQNARGRTASHGGHCAARAAAILLQPAVRAPRRPRRCQW